MYICTNIYICAEREREREKEAKCMQQGTICRPTDAPQAAVQDVNHVWNKPSACLILLVPLAMPATRVSI